ncbi:MAG: DUF6029 family protein [Pseudomonadota bacterium]|nr:DUF6029 family protein [Pseudomonadota bacterium]
MILSLLVGLAHADDVPPVAPAAPAPAPRPAEGLLSSLHGSEDLRIRYWHVPEKLKYFEDRNILDYVEVVERLDLAGGSQNVGVGARVDGVGLFANRYILDGELFHERELLGEGLSSPFQDAYFNLEKIWVEARSPVFTVTAGDNYLSFGRGIALNAVKTTDIDVDTSLRGVRGVGHFGLWDVTLATGLTNPQQVALENPNLSLVPDVAHAISGLRIDRYGLGPVNLGAHGVVYQYSRGYKAGQDGWRAYAQSVDAWATGASVEALGVKGLDLYFEGDAFGYEAPEIPVKGGYALYGSLAAYPGKTSILVELRRNKDTEWLNSFTSAYELVSGPTLEYERVITEDSAAGVNSNDVTGGRARIDLRFGNPERHVTLVPYASVAVFRDEDLGGLHFNRAPETILHPIVGVQYIREELHVLANGGQRIDVRDPGEDGLALGADRLLHADMDISIPLAGKVSLELAPALMRYQWGQNAQQQTDYTDFSNALAIKVGAPWAFILYTDYSDNPLIQSTGNLSGTLFGEAGDSLYGAVEAQWMPNSSTTLKAFYGAYRAGIRCAGGQCRTLPGFEGAKVSLTTTF